MENTYYSKLFRHLLISCFFLLATHLGAQTRNPAPYCYPTTGGMVQGTCTYSYGFNILSVKLNTLNQTSGCYGSADSDVYRFWNSSTTLTAGATYTMEITTERSTYNFGTASGFWIDFDQDSTFDSVELVGSKMSNNNVAGGVKHTFTFAVPCNAKAGSTRMRVRSQGMYQLNGNHACGNTGYYYGEAWDFQITITQPSSVIAAFDLPDTAFVKTKVLFKNKNRSGYISHAWDANNDGSFESQNSLDFTYTFTTTGGKCIKLRSTNCFGTYDTIKCMYIKSPTAIPVADFTSCYRNIEQYEVVQLFDKSTNGPYEWKWNVYDSTSGNWGSLNTGEVIADPWGNGNDEFSSSPQFEFDVPGVYTVELVSKNDVGSSKKVVRKMTIFVSAPTMYNLGYGMYGPKLNNQVHSNYGTIYDDGGPNLNYGNNQGFATKSYLSIVPDAKKPVTVQFHQLRFADTNDYIMIYDDDTVNSAKVIAKLSVSNNGTKPSYTSTSNSMYLIFKSSATGVDSGYAASYYAAGYNSSYNAPTLEHITALSELKVFNKYRDKKYRSSYQKWSIDDVLQPKFNGTDTLRYQFTDTVTHKFCLELLSCDSSVKVCKYISFQKGLMGYAAFDVNSNCVRDNGDKLLDNIMFELLDNSNSLIGKSSTSDGIYNFNISNGTYTVAIDTNSIPFQVSCPYPGIDSGFSISNGNPVAQIDFNVQCKNGFDIGAKSVVPQGRVFPGAIHTLRVLAGDLSQWYGLSCANGVSGTVKVSIAGPVTYTGAHNDALTPSVSGSTLTYSISNFGTINNNKAFAVFLRTDTSANMNDTIVISVEVTPTSGDNDSSNNKKVFRYLVRNSYDPNIKEVYPVDVPPLYNDWLTYTIHFQNTGNAEAENIRIADTLASQLDISSFQVINYSHKMVTSVVENAVTFRFPNIMLPDSFTDSKGSQGFVQYRIKPLPGMPKGTKINNTAYIYFDYNAPIVTNTTVNEFVESNSNIPDFKAVYQLNIYPNPVQDIFKVKLSSNIGNTQAKVRVYNVLGEMVYESDLNGNEAQVNLSNQTSGVYIVRIEGEGISLSACIIKQ